MRRAGFAGVSVRAGPDPRTGTRAVVAAGAARFAYNFALARVKTDLDARKHDPAHESVAWILAALRREWNARKEQVAPWWAQNSKEAASSGLADLAAGLKNWSESSMGGGDRALGFRGSSDAAAAGRASGTRPEASGYPAAVACRSRRSGMCAPTSRPPAMRCKVDSGEARILSATVARAGDRWFCSLCCEVTRSDRPARRTSSVVGVDAGVKQLAVLSAGNQVENPRALPRVQRKLRRLQRRADRQRRANNPGCYHPDGRAIKGSRPVKRSNRQDRTERRVRRLHARARTVRQNALHKLTTELAATHGTIVVEHLNARGLCRAGNRRAAACDPRCVDGGDSPPALLQDRLARRHADPGAHAIPILEDVLVVRGSESQAAAQSTYPSTASTAAWSSTGSERRT